MNPSEPTCEYAVNPLGVDTPRPRFTWILGSDQRGQMQSAYQVLVASGPEKLADHAGDKWDSGRVESGKSVNVAYEGGELASGEKCWWKVRAWDADGDAGPWSRPATFEMGLLSEEDWQGKWIGADKGVAAPMLRKEFALEKQITRARLYVSGIGWYELYLNGQGVSDHVLDPATSEYGKSVLYAVHDVTDLLAPGGNALGVMLGNGWYCEPEAEKYGDSPRLLLQLNVQFADGGTAGIVSDESWRTTSGPITQNDFYNGEIYDARLEHDGWSRCGFVDSSWQPAVLKDSPGGRMTSQLMPAIKVNEVVKAERFTCPKEGVYVYDFGRLFGGWTRLRVKGPRGAKVTIRYSARLDEQTGLLDRHRYEGEAKATDIYILKGDDGGEVYEPRFTYHPVRYVQIEGCPCERTIHDLEGCAVYSDVDLSGDFECSNDLLNRIHRNVVQTLKNGLFGIPLDCLYREHWAWTDPATITGTLYPRKHMPLFWTKWLNDIADSQGEDGAVPQICPAYHGPGFDAAWGGNYPLLVWYLHQYYGDDRILAGHYDGLKRCVDHMTSVAEGHLIKEGRYGDHMLPGTDPGGEEFISSETPRELVWTGYYYRAAYVLWQAAKLLGKDDDAKRYAALAGRIRDAFNAQWFDADAGCYAGGAQTANIFPVALGIAPEDRRQSVIDCVIRSITEQYGHHHHTGNTGTTCLIDMLTKLGFGDVWYKVVTNTTYPGWGYMVAQGATTIWESWSLVAGCGNAESMIMWATIDEFFYNELAGIKGPDYYEPNYVTPGFAEIRVAPYVPDDVNFVRASIRTVRGTVSSTWWRAGDGIILQVDVPANASAKIGVPKMGLKNVTVTEGRTTVWKAGSYVAGAEGITGGREDDDYVTLDAGSGRYNFTLTGADEKTR